MFEHRCDEVDGLVIHHLATADDESTDGAVPLVMVHGVGVSADSVAGAGEGFARSMPVRIPDLPGHGRSGTPDEPPDTAGLGRWLGRWLDTLGIARVRLFGQSFGCQVAVELAVQRPELVDRVVLQGLTGDPRARSWLRQFRRWARNSRLEGSSQLGSTVRQWGQAGLVRLVRTASSAIHHPVDERLPELVAPTLVVRGERDPIVPEQWAVEATRLLPDGRLLHLPGAVHTVTSTHPEQVVDAVLPFLRDGERIGTVP